MLPERDFCRARRQSLEAHFELIDLCTTASSRAPALGVTPQGAARVRLQRGLSLVIPKPQSQSQSDPGLTRHISLNP